MPARAPPCPVRKYARDVASGKIVAGRLVRLAAQRHLDDLKHGAARGLRWNAAKADRGIRFFELLTLPTGQRFKLQPFQKFILGSLLGWEKPDGNRRYQTAYVEQGKGNGKTPFGGALMLYGLAADGEAGAECYTAATTREQAGICFRDCKILAESSPAIKAHLDIGLHNIAHLASNSFARALSSEGRSLDGKRVHVAVLDEIHEHPSALVVDKIRAGRKNRLQPLILEITNSGHDRTTVCWAHHDYSMKVLEGTLEDDSWFGYVCQLDPCEAHRAEGQLQPIANCPDCDQWTDETKWLKANPGLGTILPLAYLQQQVREAQGMPSQVGIVQRLNFCIWTSGMTAAIPMDAWHACGTDRDLAAECLGRECFCGLDIGATSDFCAFLAAFPDKDGEAVEITPDLTRPKVTQTIVRRGYTLLPFLWLPEHPRRRDERTEQLIRTWRARGYVRTTPGSETHYDTVFSDIQAFGDSHLVRTLAIDRGFQGASIAQHLSAHFGPSVVVAFVQGILSMNVPFRELVELLALRKIRHPHNPILTWMAGNTVAETKGGLVKPSKEHSTEKIDGITAATMAIGVGLMSSVCPSPTVSCF
jgi:phage terminase large subunit-like protein